MFTRNLLNYITHQYQHDYNVRCLSFQGTDNYNVYQSIMIKTRPTMAVLTKSMWRREIRRRFRTRSQHNHSATPTKAELPTVYGINVSNCPPFLTDLELYRQTKMNNIQHLFNKKSSCYIIFLHLSSTLFLFSFLAGTSSFWPIKR